MRTDEAQLHHAVVYYLKTRYPHVLFRTDFAAGLKLTFGQAARHKRLQAGRAWPDLFLAEPSLTYGTAGLFLELKRDGTRIYRRDGQLVSDEHIREQAAVLEALRFRGYSAHFAVGFEEAKQLIDDHLSSGTSVVDPF